MESNSRSVFFFVAHGRDTHFFGGSNLMQIFVSSTNLGEQTNPNRVHESLQQGSFKWQVLGRSKLMLQSVAFFEGFSTA